MKNPIFIFRKLQEQYRRYLDSPLAIRYDSLHAERRLLLFGQDRRLCREPLIEPVPAYPQCGARFNQVMHELIDDLWGREIAEDIGGFLGPTLFVDKDTNEPLQPFTHQRIAFQKALVENKDVVVTTGTGSGKTECFLVPVLAEIIRESRQWPAPNPLPSTWDWWDDRHRTMRGQNPRYAPRTLQRAHETRPAVMRALLLYPLNALVEDQLIRLRFALDGTMARFSAE